MVRYIATERKRYRRQWTIQKKWDLKGYETLKSAKGIDFQSCLITSNLGQFRRDYFSHKIFSAFFKEASKTQSEIPINKK